MMTVGVGSFNKIFFELVFAFKPETRAMTGMKDRSWCVFADTRSVKASLLVLK